MLEHAIKKLVISLACTVGFATSGAAQIATAPLDPTQPVLTGAAAGWRMKATAVGSYYTGSGKHSTQGVDAFEYTRSGNTAGITLPVGPVGFEASAVNWSQQTTLGDTYTGDLPISSASAEAHLGVSHEEWASIGVSTKDASTKTFLGSDSTEDINSENSLGGSLSLQMGGVFFVGLGTNDIKSSGDSVVDNRWKETQGGVGLIFGGPEMNQLRVEVAKVSSPEKQQAGFDDIGAAYHPKTDVDYSQFEFSISGLLFAVTEKREIVYNQYTDGNATTYSNKTERVVIESGVLWVPQNGLALGFYFVNEKTTNDFEDTNSSFKIHTGYVF